ncbi:MAG: alpha/beta hydrolase [Chloroflexota bacterium]|nr:alpha/beta hydrolase [Chloroflexota bacterium]
MTAANVVDTRRDVTFGAGGGSPLAGELYAPTGKSGARSIILVPAARGSTGPASQVIAHLLAERGHIAFAPEYRVGFRTGEKGFEPYPAEAWPAPVHDIKAAVRWSRANAEMLGADPDCIVLFGGSNTGMLALAAAGIEDNARLEGDGGNPAVSSRVAAVVAASAPTALSTWGIPLIAGAGASQETVEEISPINYVRESFPATMFMHGLADEMIPPSNSEAMFAKLREAGARTELHLYAGQGHGFVSSPQFINHTADMISAFASRYAAPKV